MESRKYLPSLDNLSHYTKIFSKRYFISPTLSHSSRHSSTILYLKKQEFDIFYSTRYKYPILVAETITSQTGKNDPNAPIDRRIIEDPFRQDIDIPTKYQHTIEEYDSYMEYGGSMGHNAPAGQHKTNMSIWSETFLMSNLTPQEIVFNSGLWVLMENWCKNLNRNRNLIKIKVITGSIPNKRDNIFNGVIMNVPEKMYKIVCLQLASHPKITAMEIFIGLNQPYYISVNPNKPQFNLKPFLLSTSQYKAFEHESGISLSALLEYYGFNTKIQPFRNHLNLELNLSSGLVILMNKSKWFGKIVYSRTLQELENKWVTFQTESGIPQSEMQFHHEYYELTKKRIIREGNTKTHTHYISNSITKKYIPISKRTSKRSSKRTSKKN